MLYNYKMANDEGGWMDTGRARSEVLLKREGVGVLLRAIAAVVILAARNTSLCVFGDLLLEEVGL